MRASNRSSALFLPLIAGLPALGLLGACEPGKGLDSADTGDPLGGLVVVGDDPSDQPLPDLDDEWSARFLEGDAAFDVLFRESMGLGPAYIRTSCAACHDGDARGPGGVVKMVITEDDGVTPAADQSALPWGHTARPYVAGGATTPIEPPEDAPNLLLSERVGPAVFGRGYIEAVDPAEILALEAAQQAPLSGRVNRVSWDFAVASDPRFHDYAPDEADLIGRFGLKARVATLDGFAADAYQGDMSITTPMRPDELPNPDGLDDDALAGVDLDLETVQAVGDYLRLLDIPARDLPDNGGEALFEQIGCAGCHVPSLRTRADYAVEALADIDAPIYSDLLLHDLGEALADGMTDADAEGGEWKTAPLMGLRFFRSFLHDGRALTVADAIEAHGGEAEASATAFGDLNPDEREALLAWVSAL